MVDVLNKEIHIGDNLLIASTKKDRGITWAIHKVVGFTPCMIKIDVPNTYMKKDYTLIYPRNCIAISDDYQVQ